MASRIYQVQQGTITTAASTVQILPSGITGARGSLRTLTFPTVAPATSPILPPIVYYRNPDRTFNFDSDVLRKPITQVIRTLDSSVTIRFEEVVEDVIITEVWEARGGLSLPLFAFQDLYNYTINKPAFSAASQQYVQWGPRDRTDNVWNVEILDIQSGGGSPGKQDIRHLFAGGGPSDPVNTGTVLTPTDTFEVSPTAVVDRPIILTMRIINQV